MYNTITPIITTTYCATAITTALLLCPHVLATLEPVEDGLLAARGLRLPKELRDVLDFSLAGLQSLAVPPSEVGPCTKRSMGPGKSVGNVPYLEMHRCEGSRQGFFLRNHLGACIWKLYKASFDKQPILNDSMES